jgi:hypothetical protein
MPRLLGGYVLADLLQREFSLIREGNIEGLSPPLRSRIRRTASGCLEWCGSRDDSGYGMIRWKGATGRVTRAVWEIANGVILQSQTLICHHCDNPPCFDLGHLFTGTNSDNRRDSQAKGRAPIAKPRPPKRQKTPRQLEFPVRKGTRISITRILGLEGDDGVPSVTAIDFSGTNRLFFDLSAAFYARTGAEGQQ